MCLASQQNTAGVCSGGTMLVPYGVGGGIAAASASSSESSLSSHRVRTYSDSAMVEAGSMGGGGMLQTSPHSLEDPMSFVAPELQEETLMDVSN